RVHGGLCRITRIRRKSAAVDTGHVLLKRLVRRAITTAGTDVPGRHIGITRRSRHVLDLEVGRRDPDDSRHQRTTFPLTPTFASFFCCCVNVGWTAADWFEPWAWCMYCNCVTASASESEWPKLVDMLSFCCWNWLKSSPYLSQPYVFLMLSWFRTNVENCAPVM